MAVSRDCGDRGGEVVEGSSDSLQSLTAGLRDGCCLLPQHPGAPGMPRPGAASLLPSLHPHLATPPRCPRQHDVIWSCLLRAQLTPSCVLKRWGWGGRNVLGLMFTQAAGKVFILFVSVWISALLRTDVPATAPTSPAALDPEDPTGSWSWGVRAADLHLYAEGGACFGGA